MTDHHRTPESACLACGYKLDAAGSPDGSPIDPPGDGDISLCMRCGAVMKFRADGTVRGMTDPEMDELIADREFMNQIATLVRKIHFVQAMKG